MIGDVADSAPSREELERSNQALRQLLQVGVALATAILDGDEVSEDLEERIEEVRQRTA